MLSRHLALLCLKLCLLQSPSHTKLIEEEKPLRRQLAISEADKPVHATEEDEEEEEVEITDDEAEAEEEEDTTFSAASRSEGDN